MSFFFLRIIVFNFLTINPKSWVSYSAGQNLENADSLTAKPIENLKWKKLGEVVLDTTAVNIAAEVGNIAGSSGAGY